MITSRTISFLLLMLIPPLTFAQTGRPPSSAVQRNLVQQMIVNGQFTKGCVSEADGYHKVVGVWLVDYNRDRIPELNVVAIAPCATNNGGGSRPSSWIYRKTKGGYQPILGPIEAEESFPQKTISHGYFDLNVSVNAGVNDFDQLIYKI
jgi:hypothetical protein